MHGIRHAQAATLVAAAPSLQQAAVHTHQQTAVICLPGPMQPAQCSTVMSGNDNEASEGLLAAMHDSTNIAMRRKPGLGKRVAHKPLQLRRTTHNKVSQDDSKQKVQAGSSARDDAAASTDMGVDTILCPMHGKPMCADTQISHEAQSTRGCMPVHNMHSHKGAKRKFVPPRVAKR